jgi:hypothetical protein
MSGLPLVSYRLFPSSVGFVNDQMYTFVQPKEIKGLLNLLIRKIIMTKKADNIVMRSRFLLQEIKKIVFFLEIYGTGTSEKFRNLPRPFLRPTLQIILDFCVPEKELAKTRSQI